MEYKPRLTAPEKGNKYYIPKCKGGWSSAIDVSKYSDNKLIDKNCSVLSNCAGYAYGRFNEIGEYGKCKYLSPVNAEDFPEYAKGLKTGSEPKLGAVVVWSKGKIKSSKDGCGHVAVVEKINRDCDGNIISIVTSESGYNSFIFKTRERKANSNWDQSSCYKFRCFIYQPVDFDEEVPTQINAIYNGKKIQLTSIIRNGENYIKLKEVDSKLKLAKVDWSATTGVVLTLPNKKPAAKKDKLIITLQQNSQLEVSNICYKETNYVRLKDLDEVLGLCKVSYNTVKKLPEIKA